MQKGTTDIIMSYILNTEHSHKPPSRMGSFIFNTQAGGGLRAKGDVGVVVNRLSG